MDRVRLVMLVFLVFSAVVVVTTLGRTPAFNRHLVAETVNGDGRTALNAAMYDKATYDFQRGFGLLMADALITTDTGAWHEALAPEASLARAAAAQAALESAVRLAPGNAHAWAYLAWARARNGDRVGSLDAWRISTRIAPNSKTLASTRLNLIGLLSEPSDGWQRMTDEDAAASARDIAVMELFDRRTLAFHMEASPHLAGLQSGTGNK